MAATATRSTAAGGGEPGEGHVLVCHEHRLIAAGLARECERDLDVSADIACDLDDAVAKAFDHPPDVILCSDGLSARNSLPELVGRLRESESTAPLLVMARADSARSFEEALDAGAAGYLPLLAAADVVRDAIAALREGRSAFWRHSPSGPDRTLTRREQEVLMASERGLADKQIALELGIALSTVKTHTRALYSKLAATSRTEALHHARRLGLI